MLVNIELKDMENAKPGSILIFDGKVMRPMSKEDFLKEITSEMKNYILNDEIRRKEYENVNKKISTVKEAFMILGGKKK